MDRDVSPSIVDERMASFVKACTQAHVKVTHQRLEIYRVLASTEEHPDAETIHHRVRERIPTISLDTVYRNLKLLAEHHVVSVVGMSNDRLRFDACMEPHHHFVCVKCLMIRDFHSDSLDAVGTPEEAQAFGQPLSLHMEVKGICTACGRKSDHRQ